MTVASEPPSEADVVRILAKRIDAQRQGVAIVVGLIGSHGRHIVTHGQLAQGDPRPLNGDTVFEIGSVTKVFSALLLADMVRRGEAALDDPVAKYLPSNVAIPSRGRPITLQDLATHTSGLPCMPDNFKPGDPTNPYADYSVEQLYAFLSNHQLASDVGTVFEYSNLGFGLLGHALARRAGLDYETLIHTRILAPLGMTSTAIVLSPDLEARLAPGHDAQLTPVSRWDLSPAFVGAGGLRSTANDQLTLLSAALGFHETAFGPLIDAMLMTRRPADAPGSESALGWQVTTRLGDEIVWHNGGTGGYRSFVGYRRTSRRGVVVLSNASTALSPDDIGFHLLDPSLPLATPPQERLEVAIDPTLLDNYVGRYQLNANSILAVSRQGDHLFISEAGDDRSQLFPESDRDFFLKTADLQVTFEENEQGRTTSLRLRQGMWTVSAPRTGE